LVRYRELSWLLDVSTRKLRGYGPGELSLRDERSTPWLDVLGCSGVALVSTRKPDGYGPRELSRRVKRGKNVLVPWRYYWWDSLQPGW